MESIINTIEYARKGKMLDALERFHIFVQTHKGTQINDKVTEENNPIFDVLVRHLLHRGNL